MSLAASMAKFKAEQVEVAARNLQHVRPVAPVKVSTPQTGSKRPHEGSTAERKPVAVGSELMSHVIYAQEHLKEKFPNTVSFEDILAYLSLPTDLQKHNSLIKIALQDHHRVRYTPKSQSLTGKETFQYNPIHPVASAEELLTYLDTRTTFVGLSAKDLKDVWQDSTIALGKLEEQHRVLIIRNKKDETPRTVWSDDPELHAKLDPEFKDFWSKTKLPAADIDVRTELEKAGLTPTSQVKEVRKVEPRKKEKRRINRAGGKTTNLHMMGILKDYSKR